MSKRAFSMIKTDKLLLRSDNNKLDKPHQKYQSESFSILFEEKKIKHFVL